MDRRQKKTREAVFTAFHALLERKRFSEITVQEIIDEADVGRSTFYQHFATKDALLEAMCAEMFAHVVSAHPYTEATHDFSHASGEESVLTHLLYHLRESRQDLEGILSDQSGEVFLRYFRQYLNDVFLAQYGRKIEQCRAVPAGFLLNHLSCSFVELVNWWIRNGMRQSPEELEQYFLAVTEPVFRGD